MQDLNCDIRWFAVSGVGDNAVGDSRHCRKSASFRSKTRKITTQQVSVHTYIHKKIA